MNKQKIHSILSSLNVSVEMAVKIIEELSEPEKESFDIHNVAYKITNYERLTCPNEKCGSLNITYTDTGTTLCKHNIAVGYRCLECDNHWVSQYTIDKHWSN